MNDEQRLCLSGILCLHSIEDMKDVLFLHSVEQPLGTVLSMFAGKNSVKVTIQAFDAQSSVNGDKKIERIELSGRIESEIGFTPCLADEWGIDTENRFRIARTHPNSEWEHLLGKWLIIEVVKNK